MGASEFYPRFWQYLHEKHSLGDTIVYTLCGGSKLPSEWQRGIAVVEEIPNSKELPVILAGIVEYPKATPWRGEAR